MMRIEVYGDDLKQVQQNLKLAYEKLLKVNDFTDYEQIPLGCDIIEV